VRTGVGKWNKPIGRECTRIHANNKGWNVTEQRLSEGCTTLVPGGYRGRSEQGDDSRLDRAKAKDLRFFGHRTPKEWPLRGNLWMGVLVVIKSTWFVLAA
jgi:hypothetical protein